MREPVSELFSTIQADYVTGTRPNRRGFSASNQVSVGGLIRQLKTDYRLGLLPSRRGFSGFGECPGEPGCPGDVPWHQPKPLTIEEIDRLEPWVPLQDLKPDLPWYQDLFDFIRNTFTFSSGPARALQASRLIPSGKAKMPVGLNSFNQCAFYEKRSYEGCTPDPVMIGIMLVAGVLVIKTIQS